MAIATPLPQEYIQFSPGDVLGFYIKEANEGERQESNGIVMRTGPDSESVWYASIAPTLAVPQSGDCPYPVGREGILNSSTAAAPVISISVGEVYFELGTVWGIIL